MWLTAPGVEFLRGGGSSSAVQVASWVSCLGVPPVMQVAALELCVQHVVGDLYACPRARGDGATF